MEVSQGGRRIKVAEHILKKILPIPNCVFVFFILLFRFASFLYLAL